MEYNKAIFFVVFLYYLLPLAVSEDGTENFTVTVGYCISCNQTRGSISTGLCPYRFIDLEFNDILIGGKPNFIITNITSCSMLNDAMCGQLNREGLLCSKCKAGYGPALYSRTWKCEKCNDRRYLMWTLYLFLKLTPLTVFFIIVIIFNIRATSPPFTAYILYCQFFTNLFNSNVFFYTYIIKLVHPAIYKSVFTIIDVWSLDFFRHIIPPFCVDERLVNIHVLLIELLPPLYLLLLIFITYMCIELHARNFYVVVKLWKPFNRCVAKVRRSYDPKASIFNAFSAFILLSCCNILFICYNLTYSVKIVQSFFNSSEPHSKVYQLSYYEPDKPIKKQMVYFVPLFVLTFLLVVIPILVLLLYPVRLFRKFLLFICCKDLRCVQSFVDTFQGHYKDGTNGTRDYRALVSLSLIFRLYLMDDYQRDSITEGRRDQLTNDNILLIILSICYLTLRPLKKDYRSILEGLLYSTAAIIGFSISSFSLTNMIRHHYIKIYIIMLSIALPSVVASALFVHRLALRITTYKNCILFLKRVLLRRKDVPPQITEDDFPYNRMTSPSVYTPII